MHIRHSIQTDPNIEGSFCNGNDIKNTTEEIARPKLHANRF